jgi:hypothetical protein
MLVVVVPEAVIAIPEGERSAVCRVAPTSAKILVDLLGWPIATGCLDGKKN